MSRSKGNIYEICGVAGSGKSTTFAAFKDDEFKLGFRLSERKTVWDIMCALVESIIPILRSGRGGLFFLRWKNIIYLNAMFRVLSRQASIAEQSRILDQGPVYIQAFLLTPVRGYVPSSTMQSWIIKDIERWSILIGGIVILKADLKTILHRVNTRSQEHFVKGKDASVAGRFLREYSKSYDNVLNVYGEVGVKVRSIDTSRYGVDEVKIMTKEFIDG